MKKTIRQIQGKHFYSHVIETSIISLELGGMSLTQEERVHLSNLAEVQLNHVIIDTILSELSEEDKKVFLHHLSFDNHDKIWDFLNSKVQNIQEKIKKAAEDFKKELHRDIKET